MYVDWNRNWAVACDFQQCGLLTFVDSDEPVHPPFKLRNFEWGSVSSLTVIEYWRDQQRLWSVCAYVQAGLSLCWSHIPNCWKCITVTEDCISLANSADPDQMSSFVTFYLGLHCLIKYLFTGIQNENGLLQYLSPNFFKKAKGKL